MAANAVATDCHLAPDPAGVAGAVQKQEPAERIAAQAKSSLGTANLDQGRQQVRHERLPTVEVADGYKGAIGLEADGVASEQALERRFIRGCYVVPGERPHVVANLPERLQHVRIRRPGRNRDLVVLDEATRLGRIGQVIVHRVAGPGAQAMMTAGPVPGVHDDEQLLDAEPRTNVHHGRSYVIIRAMLLDGIGSLALARLRRRSGQWLSIGAAVAAAVALVAILGGLSVLATDQALRGTLTVLDPADRAVQVSLYEPSPTDAATWDVAARTAIGGLGTVVGSPVAGILFNRARDLHHLAATDVQILATDNLASWTTLTSGRLPTTCSASPCEALLISHGAAADALPGTVTIAGLEVRIVGRGTLTSSLPVGRPDLTADATLGFDPFDTTPSPPPAFLLVEGSRATAGLPQLADVGRTYRWTAPVDPANVHPWTTARTTAAISRLERELAATTSDFGVRSPADAMATVLARGRTAAGRLQLLGALAVAVLVAFAVFAGIVARRDVALEVRRLRRAGANPAQCAVLLLVEVFTPAAGAALVGLALGAAIVAAMAGASGSPIGPLLGAALLDPGTLARVGGIGVGAALGVLLGILVTPTRGFVSGLLPGLVAIGALLGWQLLSGEGLTDQLLRGSLSGPVLVLLPAAIAFGIAGLFLVAVPIGFRLLARRAGRVRLPIRLALLSLARESARPAATLALLALSVGALVFALAYGDTIRTGIADQSAFESGADLRVTEAGTSLTLSGTVVPVNRYASLGPGVRAWPVLHRTASVAGIGDVTLLGLDPASMGQLAGWRSDFSTLSAAEIGRRLVISGDFRLPGHPLPADAPNLTFGLDLAGDPVKLHATVATPDGDFAQLFLGSFLPGHTQIQARLPPTARGGTLVALRVSDTSLVAGPAHPGSLGRSTLQFHGLGGLVADGAPVAAEVGGIVEQLIRSPLPTDNLALPAIVSPDLAAAADPDGTLELPLGRSVIRIRVVGTATRVPTVLGAQERFVVAAFAPLVLAINGVLPGTGHPDEMWIRTADVVTAARVATALAQPPFRAAIVRSRFTVAAARMADPFAGALVAALLASALTGLALASLGLGLGAVADLRDETGELADLEAQGVPPSALRTLAQARTVLLAGGGVVAGLVAGVVLTVVTTSALALAAGATISVPALRIVLPWPMLMLVALLPLVGASLLVAILSRRDRRSTR